MGLGIDNKLYKPSRYRRGQEFKEQYVSELTKLAMISERLDPIFYLDSCSLLGHV
jgi:hypothetical protein